MADYIKKILTSAGEKQIDYTALANLPDVYTRSEADKAEIIELVTQNTYTKEETLSESTKTAYGLDSSAIPNDVFSKLASASVPTGTICWYAKDDIPSGYLKCDGSAISRSNYLALFTVIGTVFGTGNGSTTFNIPDLRAKFIRGSGTSGFYSATFGNTQNATRIVNNGIAEQRSVNNNGVMMYYTSYYNYSSMSDGDSLSSTSGSAAYSDNGKSISCTSGFTRPYNIALTPIIKY